MQSGATPALADWHHIFDSLPDEHDYVVDEVEGALPAGLRGTLYRNGPGINEVGGRPFAHLFDGHGMISQFMLDGRTVRYRNRFVRTHKFLAERDADRPSARVGRLIAGRSVDRALRWDPSKPTCVLLVPREGGKPRLIETDPFFHFHVNNAFEDGGDTVVDLVRYDDYSIGKNSLREFRTGGFDEPAALWRLRIKSGGDDIERHELCSWQCEFPQHDWRRTTLGYRFSYLAGRPSGAGPQTSIIKVDHDTGRCSAHSFAEDEVAGEPIFVPRSPDSGEDDGWLLSVVYSAARHRSRLVVLDAGDVEREPVASAHLRHHVPLGFHGTFSSRLPPIPDATVGDGSRMA
jgi:carotenoid cleavage dioxygenase-like enzyme